MVSTRRSFLRKSSTAAAGIATLSTAGCLGNSGGDGTVKLGAINPLSGPAAFYGDLATKAQSAWAGKVNDEGGLSVGGDKRDVTLVEYDDESKNSQARSAAKRLCEVDQVSTILSSWRSTGAIAINPIVNENNVPTFTHGFTPKVNTPGTYVLRLTVSTVMDAYPALKSVEESSEIQNIGVIAEEGDWGDDTLDLMEWWFSETDGDFENLGRFSFGQQDFSPFITKAKQQYEKGNIDALYVQTWASAMQRFLEQQHREGLHETMPILTGLGGADFNNIEKVGKAMENVHAFGVYTRLSYADDPAIKKTLSKESLSQFEEYRKLDAPDHPVSYNVYADAQAAQFALEEAGETDGQALREALTGTEFTTVLGKSKINDRGQPAVPGALIKFGADGEEASIDSVAWNGQLPSITDIPPKTNLR